MKFLLSISYAKKIRNDIIMKMLIEVCNFVQHIVAKKMSKKTMNFRES